MKQGMYFLNIQILLYLKPLCCVLNSQIFWSQFVQFLTMVFMFIDFL